LYLSTNNPDVTIELSSRNQEKQNGNPEIKGGIGMEIKKAAMAGTLESSDAQVTVEPGNGQIDLSVESSVIHQFGRQIKAAVLETLDRLGVTDAKVTVVDKGALDCTLKARVECAVYRANDMTQNLPWGGVIR
jgi:citrate lyase subunit gamma (acyl carrier protein)